jgi:hypothetical protein
MSSHMISIPFGNRSAPILVMLNNIEEHFERDGNKGEEAVRC